MENVIINDGICTDTSIQLYTLKKRPELCFIALPPEQHSHFLLHSSCGFLEETLKVGPVDH